MLTLVLQGWYQEALLIYNMTAQAGVDIYIYGWGRLMSWLNIYLLQTMDANLLRWMLIYLLRNVINNIYSVFQCI